MDSLHANFQNDVSLLNLSGSEFESRDCASGGHNQSLPSEKLFGFRCETPTHAIPLGTLSGCQEGQPNANGLKHTLSDGELFYRLQDRPEVSMMLTVSSTYQSSLDFSNPIGIVFSKAAPMWVICQAVRWELPWRLA
jgi:hypothetical protein